MALKAYPVLEKIIDGETWKRTSKNYSFSLYSLKPEEEEFLHNTQFYYWLNEECTGQTEINKEDISEYLDTLRPEERFRIKDIIHIINKDMNSDYASYEVC
jgi:hypothetical protein